MNNEKSKFGRCDVIMPITMNGVCFDRVPSGPLNPVEHDKMRRFDLCLPAAFLMMNKGFPRQKKSGNCSRQAIYCRASA